VKLFYSPTSPYARKVLIVAAVAGLDAQLERVGVNPFDSPAELLAVNPLSRVPCLVTRDGIPLFDSPVICEFLDETGSANLFPPAGPARWRALKLQAIGDGIMDAAVTRRMEQGRPEEQARTANIERQAGVVERALDVLERQPPADHLDIGAISVACALGYLDFRFAADAWRERRPKLAAWYATMAQRPELTATAPP
jgi:glutathione S-transferase